MKLWAAMTLTTRAVVATGGILFLALGLNTALNSYSAAGKYRNAVMGRTTALAEGVKKDIDKVTGFGLPLSAMDGMSDKLRGLMESDKDIAGAMVMDRTGRSSMPPTRPAKAPGGRSRKPEGPGGRRSPGAGVYRCGRGPV